MKAMGLMYTITLIIMVFCLPHLSARIPMAIRAMLLTALFKASNNDPVEEEYARIEVEYVGK